MHSKIIQMERNPITKENRFCVSDVEDGFVGRIADYVDEVDEDYIPYMIQNVFGNEDMFEFDCGDMTVVVKDKKKYFEMQFEKFKYALEKLCANVTLEAFSKPPCEDNGLNYDLYSCNTAYNDKYGIYIFNEEYGGVMSMDEWMRWLKDNDRFYVGGAVDYHF